MATLADYRMLRHKVASPLAPTGHQIMNYGETTKSVVAPCKTFQPESHVRVNLQPVRGVLVIVRTAFSINGPNRARRPQAPRYRASRRLEVL